MTRAPLIVAVLALGLGGALEVACSSSSTAAAPVDGGVDGHTAPHADAHADAPRDARHDRGVVDIVDASADVPGFVAAEGGTPAMIDDANCVPPGTPSNSAGVGGYCSPNGGQCAGTSADGAAAVCTADFNVPAHAWFCTIACTGAGQCGAGSASCLPSIMGEACIPAACAALLGDTPDGGAADALSDVASEASSSPDAG